MISCGKRWPLYGEAAVADDVCMRQVSHHSHPHYCLARTLTIPRARCGTMVIPVLHTDGCSQAYPASTTARMRVVASTGRAEARAGAACSHAYVTQNDAHGWAGPCGGSHRASRQSVRAGRGRLARGVLPARSPDAFHRSSGPLPERDVAGKRRPARHVPPPVRLSALVCDSIARTDRSGAAAIRRPTAASNSAVCPCA
jgi:hypothetical protein